MIKNTGGLWSNNPNLVQLLGLCPLLAVTTTLVNGFFLGFVTAIVMALSGAVVACVRDFIPAQVRLPIFILVVASLVTVLELLVKAFFYDVYLALGIFIPLIVTNCIVLARVEAFSARNTPWLSLWDGIYMGGGLIWVMALLGGIREILSAGTLFAGIDAYNVPWRGIQILSAQYPGFLLALLPAGAFILLAFMVAFKSWVDAHQQAYKAVPQLKSTESVEA